MARKFIGAVLALGLMLGMAGAQAQNYSPLEDDTDRTQELIDELRGLIDAAEFNNPTSDKDFGMQDVSKDYHLASFHQSQETFEVIFNKTLFNKLTDEQRAILEVASEAASADMSWKYQDRYSNDLISLETEHGVNIHRTPDSIMDAQLKAWDIVVAQLSGEDPFFAKVVESQKAWAKRVVRYELLNAPNYQGAYEHYYGSL